LCPENSVDDQRQPPEDMMQVSCTALLSEQGNIMYLVVNNLKSCISSYRKIR